MDIFEWLKIEILCDKYLCVVKFCVESQVYYSIL